MIEQLYDIHYAAEILGVKPHWVKKWRRDGKLKSVKAGRLVRFSEDEIARFQGIGCDEITYPNAQVNEVGEPIGEFARALISSLAA